MQKKFNIFEKWIREDYQEMNELLIIYFGGKVQRVNTNGVPYDHTWKMQQPGAVSHARFMSKAIYIMKILMTHHQLPLNVLSEEEKYQIEYISNFFFFIYAQYFLQVMVSSVAPRLDLAFWENVHHFSSIDNVLVESVFSSIYRHLWYLSEELVPLALCDSGTMHKEKTEIIKKMLSFERPHIFHPQNS